MIMTLLRPRAMFNTPGRGAMSACQQHDLGEGVNVLTGARIRSGDPRTKLATGPAVPMPEQERVRRYRSLSPG